MNNISLYFRAHIARSTTAAVNLAVNMPSNRNIRFAENLLAVKTSAVRQRSYSPIYLYQKRTGRYSELSNKLKSIANAQQSPSSDSAVTQMNSHSIMYETAWANWEKEATGIIVEYRGEAVRRMRQCLESNDHELRLSGLGLSSLPNRLPPGLRYLYVNNNQLIQLPANLSSELMMLDACYNQLTTLPESATRMPSSGLVNIGGNPLSEQTRQCLQEAKNSKSNRAGPRIYFNNPTFQLGGAVTDSSLC